MAMLHLQSIDQHKRVVRCTQPPGVAYMLLLVRGRDLFRLVMTYQMGKARIVLLISIIAGVSILGFLIYVRGFESVFDLWNINSRHTPWLDLRLITQSSYSYAQGYDPAIQNPGDPLHRVFNYPKIWYLLFAAGINDAWTWPLAVAMVSLFFAAVVFFPGRLSSVTTLLLLLSLASPAVMLGVARANVDLLIFIAMAGSLLLAPESPIAALGILLIAILLKLFPVLGSGLFMTRERSGSLKFLLGPVAFTAIYFLASLHDMLLVTGNSQTGIERTYGIGVLPAFAKQAAHSVALGKSLPWLYASMSLANRVFTAHPFLPVAIATALCSAAIFLGSRYRDQLDTVDPRNFRAFWMGAPIYVGSFFFGTNWEYRLIFALFCLPQLVDWATLVERWRKWIAILTLCMLFVSLWQTLFVPSINSIIPFGSYFLLLFDQAATWTLLTTLVWLLASSMPGWLFQDMVSLLRKAAHTTPAAER